MAQSAGEAEPVGTRAGRRPEAPQPGEPSSVTPEQIAGYLREPRIADLVTLRPDGSPHVTPVWYDYDGSLFRFIVEPTSVKARNVGRDPRVALSVATATTPYEYVIVDGSASISDEDYKELLWDMSVHYLGKGEGERYAAKVYREEIYCTIVSTPSKITGWSSDI